MPASIAYTMNRPVWAATIGAWLALGAAAPAAAFPDGSGYGSIPVLSLNPRIDVMCQSKRAWPLP